MQTISDTCRRNERRALIALVAVFALVVQAFWPVAAAAAPDFGGAALVCTGHSLETAPAGAPDKSAPGQPCQHCVCPVVAALPPVVTAGPGEAVRYAHAAPPVRSAQDPAPGRGLAAPPPPSRGPPVLLT